MDSMNNNAPYGYLILDDNGYIKEINNTLLTLLDYEYSELIHSNIENLLSNVSKMMFHSSFFLQIQLNGHGNEVQLTVRSKFGKDIPVLLMGHRHELNGEDVISCVIINMTKRFDYEKELHHVRSELEEAYKNKKAMLEQENKLRKLLETTFHSIGEGLIVTDATGHITLMNPLGEQYTAWSNEEAINVHIDDVLQIIDSSTKEKLNIPVYEVLKNGETLDFKDNIMLIGKDGSEHFISGNVAAIFSDEHKITGSVIAIKDITKQYVQEKAIESFLNINLDMLSVSDLDANFHRVNKKFEEVLGYTSEELVGKSYLSFIHEEDIELTLDTIKNLANNKKVSSFINRYRCKDGTYKFIEWQAINGVGNYTYASARDVTEKIKLEQERLKMSEEKYQFLAENVLDVIWVYNLGTQQYTYVSPSVYQQTGFTVQEMMNLHLEEIFTPDSLNIVRETVAKAQTYLEQKPTSTYKATVELQRLCKNGDIIWLEVAVRFYQNPQGDIEIVSTSRNIQERKQLEKFKHLSYHDQLTGLYNRQFLNSIIDDEMSRSDRFSQPLSMCIMDLDRFKNVNDTWGHPVGDELLKITATIISEKKRKSDLLFRLGGEEFVILCPNIPVKKALVIAERIRQAIEDYIHPITGKQTISIGVSERVKNESFFDWYKRADEALYEAKNTGRNRVVASN